jgi:NADPH:quinone reductase-like Zn-dependent oxidoreductase
MRAARISQWGQPAQIEDISPPQCGEGEVLVRVRAAAVNGIDWRVAAGYIQSRVTAPVTLGTDFCGEVVSVGTDVTHVGVEDAVYGFVPLRGGTFAEYAVVKANEVALKPHSLDFTQAAAVPLVALTAWQALFDLAKLQSGERLLVLGAGGGVGSFAVQLAKEGGAYVIGVVGADKQDFVRELGVDEQINYQQQRFEEVVSDIDVVVDTVGGEMIERAMGLLKAGGRLVTVGRLDQDKPTRPGVAAFSVFAQPNRVQLGSVCKL